MVLNLRKVSKDRAGGFDVRDFWMTIAHLLLTSPMGPRQVSGRDQVGMTKDHVPDAWGSSSFGTSGGKSSTGVKYSNPVLDGSLKSL